MTERTLSIVKPDAVGKRFIGQILARYEQAGMRVIAGKFTRLSRRDAEAFYAVHKSRPFFADLVNYMVSGPVFISVLEGEGAIARHREIMGATDPAKAAAGTIRKDFGESIEHNAVHGSDGADTARAEIAHFFSGLELHG